MDRMLRQQVCFSIKAGLLRPSAFLFILLSTPLQHTLSHLPTPSSEDILTILFHTLTHSSYDQDLQCHPSSVDSLSERATLDSNQIQTSSKIYAAVSLTHTFSEDRQRTYLVSKTSLNRMPPKTPATLPAPGPSYTGQGMAGYEQEDRAPWKPAIYGKYLSEEEIETFTFFYNRYDYKGRPLSQEEVCDMWGLMKDREPPNCARLKDHFGELDNVNGPCRIYAEGLIRRNTEDLRARADRLVDYLCTNFRAFRERFEVYDGL